MLVARFVSCAPTLSAHSSITCNTHTQGELDDMQTARRGSASALLRTACAAAARARVAPAVRHRFLFRKQFCAPTLSAASPATQTADGKVSCSWTTKTGCTTGWRQQRRRQHRQHSSQLHLHLTGAQGTRAHCVLRAELCGSGLPGTRACIRAGCEQNGFDSSQKLGGFLSGAKPPPANPGSL